MNQWQPIETAPKGDGKDGPYILLVWPNGGIDICRWRLNRRIGRAWFTNTDEWDDYDLEKDQPTHWMPLPERSK